MDDFALFNSLKDLAQVKGMLNLNELPIYAPLCQNPSFMPGLLDKIITLWSEKTLSTVKDLYINGHIASFSHLQQKYNLPSGNLFCTCKFGFLLSNLYLLIQCSTNTIFIILNPNLDRIPHIQIFQFVTLFSSATPSQQIKDTWTGYLELDISNDLWARWLKRIRGLTSNLTPCHKKFFLLVVWLYTIFKISQKSQYINIPQFLLMNSLNSYIECKLYLWTLFHFSGFLFLPCT